MMKPIFISTMLITALIAGSALAADCPGTGCDLINLHLGSYNIEKDANVQKLLTNQNIEDLRKLDLLITEEKMRFFENQYSKEFQAWKSAEARYIEIQKEYDSIKPKYDALFKKAAEKRGEILAVNRKHSSDLLLYKNGTLHEDPREAVKIIQAQLKSIEALEKNLKSIEENISKVFNDKIKNIFASQRLAYDEMNLTKHTYFQKVYGSTQEKIKFSNFSKDHPAYPHLEAIKKAYAAKNKIMLGAVSIFGITLGSAQAAVEAQEGTASISSSEFQGKKTAPNFMSSVDELDQSAHDAK